MISALVAEISNAIAEHSGDAFNVTRHFEAAGGCINRSMGLLGADGRRFFVKINQAAQLGMFEAEAAGLAALRAAQAIRVPAPLTHGLAAGQSFLVMEWLDLKRTDGTVGILLGEQLAGLHAKTWHAFGWLRDNTIGSTPQANPETDDWIVFFREQRLRPQLDLAAANGASRGLIDRGTHLLAVVKDFFSGYAPHPGLLHGDLWSGNAGVCAGQPVLFDPAVYYGDRESDIAMTELFGGFPASFYVAYNAAWPLDPGYSTRKRLYQLYHLLNHFNLFGESYARQSQETIDWLLAELR